MKTKFYFLFLILIFSLTVAAQNEKNYRTVPFQISLVPPIGTNGIYGATTVNKLSLNIFAGYSAGLEGLELGGFANINSDFMTGVQFGGFTNITGGTVDGVQFAGFTNITGGEVYGAQFAGFTNINKGATKGFQAAGFLNIIKDTSRTVQIAGFANLSHHIEGAQIAGFTNISSGNVKGVQISGFLNSARVVDGAQIGFLNIADSVKNGIPIGFLSIVKGGFREFEVGFSEGFNSYASFKIGVSRFYNIFSVGVQSLSDQFRWGFGYGIGTHLADRENFQANLELMSYHVNEGAHFTNSYNDLQQVKLSFARSMSKNVSIYFGPTLNLMISDYHKYRNIRTGSNFAPYSIFNKWSGQTNLKYWIGFNAGIRIH